jgi:hypothetical protein
MASENNVPLDIDVLQKDYIMIYCMISHRMPSKDDKHREYIEKIGRFHDFEFLWNISGTCKMRPNSDGWIFLSNPRHSWTVNAQFVKRN